MAVVLAVIGLIVGGVVSGGSLIRSSQLQAVVSEANRYEAAIIKFEDKYHDYPGDMSDAQNYWGTATNNGNGNQIIEAAGAANTSGEAFEFWNQLALSGQITGQYKGTAGPASGSDTIPGVNAPASRLGGNGWSVVNLANYAGDNNSYAFNYGNVLAYGGTKSGSITVAGALKPAEAAQVDTKIDDGKPASGVVMAVDAAGFPASASTKCTTSATNSDFTGSYNYSSSSQKACGFYFVLHALNGQVTTPVGAPLPPVNGVCNNSVALGCVSGLDDHDNGQTACGTTRQWVCDGTNGGANSGTCSLSNGTCAVNGACNNTVALGCASGSATGDNGLTACSTTRQWVCTGSGGGSNSATCSKANAACVVNGVCNNATPLGCTAGVETGDNGLSACGTSRQWVCAGSGGGSNSGTCSFSNGACAVNGVCNNGVALGCSAGSATSDNGQTACGTTRTWVCAGSGGGSNSGGCSKANAACVVNGVCGGAGACGAGSVSGDNGATACGTTRTWSCVGSGGGSTAGCSLANAACAVPVNGSCGGPGACGAGSVSGDNGATACGTTRTWSCVGSNGGSTAGCSSSNGACAVNGVCGGAGACSAGSVSGDNGATACGTTRTWSCVGSGGGSTASCSSANAACAGCSSQTVTWGAACSGTALVAASGGTQVVSNTATNYLGSANVSCNNGAFTATSISCTFHITTMCHSTGAHHMSACLQPGGSDCVSGPTGCNYGSYYMCEC